MLDPTNSARQAKASDDAVAALVKEVASRHGLELVKVQVVKHGRRGLVRAFLDKEGGITLDDCEAVSKELSRRLDVLDPLEGPYALEVSSPGLDREMLSDRDYSRFSGRMVSVSTTVPVNGKRNFKARLRGLDEQGRAVLELEGMTVAVPRSDLSRVRLIPEFRT